MTPVSPFDFGSVNVGSSSAPQTFTINNVGDADLIIGTIGNGILEYAISSDNCSGQTVAASGSCTLQVTFTPSIYGWQIDTMTIPSNAPGSPTLVTLEGTGEASDIGVNPISPFGFGSVNVGSSSSPQTFTISNTGNVGLVIGTINIDNSEYVISNDNCSSQTVAALGSCTLDVTFTPATYGASAGLMSIPSNDPETPTFSVTLNGTGEASNIGVSPISPFGFGSVNVGSSLPQTFTVSNTGNFGLVIGTITSSSGEFEIFSDTCSGTTVPASGSCTLDVSFAPSTSGTRTSELQIPSNDPDSPTFTVSLNGTGVQYIVTPSAGANGSISPSTPQTVNYNNTTAFTVTPDSGYHIDTVGGTCGGSLEGNTYTTAAIIADCTVDATFAINTYTVTPSVALGLGTISPDTAQTVNHNGTTAFTVTPDSGYHIDTVGGTCGGSLVGSTYTTSAVTANCTVIANFAIDTFTVTPSVTGSGTITPDTAQTVNYNGTTAFTVTPAAGNHIVNVTGTCGGTLVGSTFTTSAITADCTVIANFAIDTFTVTPSVTGSGTITPDTAQTVNYNGTTAFTVTPTAGNHIVNVTGTCGGSLVGDTYTTAAVTANCTVIANFAIDTFTVTPSVTGSGTITPDTAQTVNYNGTTAFTLTPSAGNHIVNVTGTCGGSLVGSTFTTSAVTANCTVIANFAIDTFTVTPSAGANGSISPNTPQTVNSGGTTAFTVTPDPGYHIDTVGGTCGGSLAGDTYTTAAVTANCTVDATFAADSQTYTISSNSVNGVISCTPTTVDHGGEFTCSILPNSGYYIDLLTDNAVDVTDSIIGGNYTVTNVTADHTISGTFLSCDVKVVSGVDEYCYWSLSTAYSEAASGDLFEIKGITFTGDLDLNQLLSVIFAGGYDSGFTAQTGWTTIYGNLIISKGYVEVEYIDIR